MLPKSEPGPEEDCYSLRRELTYGDVKCSIGNTANNIVTAMYGARWVPDGDHSVRYTNVQSLLYT